MKKSSVLGASAVCISKVSWHHFSSSLRCPFRRHVKGCTVHQDPHSVVSAVLSSISRWGRVPVPAAPGETCALRCAAGRRMSEQAKGSASASAAAPPPESDTYKGWLFKWTNYLKGYQRRWFVLSNGLLSYYR